MGSERTLAQSTLRAADELWSQGTRLSAAVLAIATAFDARQDVGSRGVTTWRFPDGSKLRVKKLPGDVVEVGVVSHG